jgi:hypothetical protein
LIIDMTPIWMEIQVAWACSLMRNPSGEMLNLL